MRIVYKITVIILISGFLSGCLQNSELDKMSNKEIEKYFISHKKELKHLIDICENNSAIKRVEKSESLFYIKNPSTQIIKVAEEAQSIVKQLKIDSMQCSRSDMDLDNKLMGISFVLYSAGLGVSGEGQFISYDTKRFLDSLPNHKKANIPWRTIFPLPEEGWSIVHTK